MFISTLLLSTFFLPWLILFFMRWNEIKRFMEVTWLTIVLNVLLYDCGIALNLWEIKQNAYPFVEIPPFFFGLYPVVALLMLKFLYGTFWKYMLGNLVSDSVFAFLFLPWLASRGVFGYVNYLAVLIIALSLATIIYAYQMLREGAFHERK